MTTIKFRCWNGEQMVSPDYVTRGGLGWWKENSIPTSSDKLIRFTGLHDRNGKEIWEGDILKIEMNPPMTRPIEVIGVVEWESTFGGWIVDFPDLGEAHGFFEITERFEGDSEIIGNVWENPELLK